MKIREFPKGLPLSNDWVSSSLTLSKHAPAGFAAILNLAPENQNCYQVLER